VCEYARNAVADFTLAGGHVGSATLTFEGAEFEELDRLALGDWRLGRLSRVVGRRGARRPVGAALTGRALSVGRQGAGMTAVGLVVSALVERNVEQVGRVEVSQTRPGGC
jgi:hypothetical protein